MISDYPAIYAPPALEEEDHAVIALIEEQRGRLRSYAQHAPRRWLGSLRRSTFARAIQGSNSIEGYNVTIDDAIAAVENEPPFDERTESWLAVKGYRDALTCILQASQDPWFEFSKQFLKSLHFMMVGYDLSKHPGHWRPGAIFIVAAQSGETVYEGPAAEHVNPLVEQLVGYLRSTGTEPNMVKAAMAHLNLTMIHPFKDGNGRMARALQTLVLARDGVLHPTFASIEEWLGRNTEEYYAVLAQTGEGRWNPGRSAQAWVRFNLKAHFQQAATLLRRTEEYAKLYEGIEELVAQRGLPDRALLPVFDAALGLRLTNARYRTDAEVTEFVASRDLKRLTEAGLLEPTGEKRGRTYSAAKPLADLRMASRIRRPLEDPFALIQRGAQPALPAAADPRLPGL
jgi:Fic family protein